MRVRYPSTGTIPDWATTPIAGPPPLNHPSCSLCATTRLPTPPPSPGAQVFVGPSLATSAHKVFPPLPLPFLLC